MLKFLNVSTEPASVCKKFYGYRLKAGMICAKPPGDRDGVCVVCTKNVVNVNSYNFSVSN